MLTCSRLSAIRDNKLLFKEIGFTLFNGSCLFIKGENGIGKTTLLKILANLFEKNSGDIFYNGINIKLALKEYLSLISFLDNTSILQKNATIFENLQFWAGIYGTELNISSALRVFSLEKYAETKIHLLSKGIKQKAMLSLLLLHNSTIWLLDEPFNSLDEEGVNILINMINARCMQQGIVIIATNENNPEIAGACDLPITNFKC